MYGNPFFLEPVPPDRTLIKRAFIDRDEENLKIERFVSLRARRLLILGRMGEGKSSLLNVAEQAAKEHMPQNGILCLRIDGLGITDIDKMLEVLLHHLQRDLERLDEKRRSELAKAVKELDIEVVSEEEREKIEGSVEAGVGGLIATLRAKVTGQIATGRKVVYRPRGAVRTETILEDILPSLFNQLQTLIVFDNTEKLGPHLFRNAIEALDRLPRNILCIATGDSQEIGRSNMDLCYKVFDDFCPMKAVDEDAIAEFVNGRLTSFSIDRKPKVRIQNDALKGLFERTRGNLRETFRYCYGALESSANADVSKPVVITRPMVVKAIADVDAPRFAALDEYDTFLMKTIAKSSGSTVDQLIRRSLHVEDKADRVTTRDRLETLRASGLLEKQMSKKGRTYVAEYGLPAILIEAIKVGSLLDMR
jgi:hypothetical protein